ncbi:Solute carrier family 13 member 3 [Araneus ventricosus]|uniref:Solute carrier family 13 member 3 n=1 Tax=Araneus ventricosus TaxID=182803 RepID=A0A4Y2T1C5_ARAVE|nr:Solute carrier family 13 member 3 [Araneus ventricosus]
MELFAEVGLTAGAFSPNKAQIAPVSPENFSERSLSLYLEAKSQETSVIVLFLILVFLWVFREPKFIPGWASVFGSDTKIGDSAPAIAVAFLLFYLPSNYRDLSSRPLLEWKVAQAKLPWGVLLLLGGGFALAHGAQVSGLSTLLGEKLSSLNFLSPGAVVAIICFMTAMITEIASNTTSATIILPVLNQMQDESYLRTDPVILMRGQMTRTTPELATPSPNFSTTPMHSGEIGQKAGHKRFFKTYCSSKQFEYKQLFEDLIATDASIFVTSLVPVYVLRNRDKQHHTGLRIIHDRLLDIVDQFDFISFRN